MNPNPPPTAEPHNIRPPSLKQKLKSSLKLPLCFHVPRQDHEQDEPTTTAMYATPRVVQSKISGSGPHGAGLDHIAPDHHFRDRAKHHYVPSRLSGRATGRHRRARTSVDFRYDAVSYSLNFDDGGEGGNISPDDIPPFRTFSSSLPASPPRTPPPQDSPTLRSPPDMHPSVPSL